MPHIPLPDLPGMPALLAYKPSTGSALSDFMEQVLRGDGPLPPAWREVIGAYVSGLNDCEYCAQTHTAAACEVGADPGLRAVAQAGADADAVDPQLAALLDIARAVVTGGHQVTPELVAAARDAGASDEAIHDALLIAAAFCMINRYVDGLGTVTPTDPAAYARSGARIAEHGYRMPPGRPGAPQPTARPASD